MKQWVYRMFILLAATLLTMGLAACGAKPDGASSQTKPSGLGEDSFEDIDIGNNPTDGTGATGGGSDTPDDPASPNRTNSSGAATTKKDGGTPTTPRTTLNLDTDPSLKPKAITLKNKKIVIIGIDQEQFRKDGSTAKFFKENYGGEIEQVVTGAGEWLTKLQSMQMAKKQVDLVTGSSNPFPDAIPQNILQTVDSVIDINHAVMRHLKDSYEKFSYKGKHYFVPWLETPTDFVFYNKKMIKDAGLTDPYALHLQGKWDWNAYKKYASDLRQRSGNTTTVWGLSLIDHHQGYLVDSTGKSTVKLDGSGNFVSNLNDADIKRAIGFLHDLVNTDKLAEVTDATARLDDGKCAMQQAPYFFNESYPKLKKSSNLGFAPMPKDPNNSSYMQSGGALGYFVSTGNVNKEGIEAFIQSAVISEKLKGLPNAKEYKENIEAQKKKYPMLTEAEIVADGNQFDAIWNLPKFFSSINYVPPQKLYWEVVKDKKPYDQVVQALEPELIGKINDLNKYIK